MRRRQKPASMMLEAIDERDIEKFAWAILEQSRLDLKEFGENKSYSTVDVLSAMRQIVAIRSKAATKTEADESDVEEWIAKPKKQTSKSL